MECADPKILCNITKEGKPVLKNYSLCTPFQRLTGTPLDVCRKCILCRRNQSHELAMRCELHASLYPKNIFLTLTYDEKLPTYHNNFELRDVQLFKKSLRKHAEPNKLDIFHVHEYGKKGKKHWHLIVFNYDFKDKEFHTIRNQHTLYKSNQLEALWKRGFASIGSVTEASAKYQAQYMEKDLQNGNYNNDHKSRSIHRGIGFPYFDVHYKQILSLGYIPYGGKKMSIPTSFIRRAHRHYCHFNDQSYFFDTPYRKKYYSPFTTEQPNLEISHLYNEYKNNPDRILFIEEKIQNYQKQASIHLNQKIIPDFQQAGENKVYDLKKHQKGEL